MDLEKWKEALGLPDSTTEFTLRMRDYEPGHAEVVARNLLYDLRR